MISPHEKGIKKKKKNEEKGEVDEKKMDQERAMRGACSSEIEKDAKRVVR